MTQRKKILRTAGMFFLFALLAATADAAVAVKVFSLDETMSNFNQSTPRIFIQNTGTESITSLTFRYYFTTENGKTPVLEDWDTPNSSVILVPGSGGYYVLYSVTGITLQPGGLLPYSSGNVVGLHYADWSAWDKTNDFSNRLNSSFLENTNIPVYVGGTRIYGNEQTSASGSVLREVWMGISGTSVDVIPVDSTPTITGSQSTLDAPRNFADNYGARIRGYITAPTSGEYIFWLASDDNAKFRLSTDATPESKVLLDSVSTYTGPDEWFKEPSQKSSPVALVAGTKYYFEILHKDGTQNDLCIVRWSKPGESTSYPGEVVPSSVLTPFVPAVIPAAPANLVATAVSATQIDLSWSDLSNNECGFMIEEADSNDVFTMVTMVSANQTSYRITGLTAETLYKYRVRAYNLTGNSDNSNVAQTTTFAVPEGTVTREVWYDVSGWSIEDIPVDDTLCSVSSLTTLETAQQMGDYYAQRIRGYIIPPLTGQYVFWIASDDQSQLWLSTNDDPSNKALIASVTTYTGYHVWTTESSQKSAAITLTAGQRYYVEVLHKEGNQNDNLSVWWSKPGENIYYPTGPIPASSLSPYIIASKPAAPSELAATAISATQIDLSWSDNSNNETGFRIERSSGGEAFVEIDVTDANVTTYHDARLTAMMQYRYRIRSYNDLGNSESYSDTASAITLEQQAGAAIPQELFDFAVYSSDTSRLCPRSVFNGGAAVGSNHLVDVQASAVVNGNVISGDSVELKSQSVVTGAVIAAGSVHEEDSSVQYGSKEEGATVAVVTIPGKTSLPTGTDSVFVANGGDVTKSQGNYTDVLVETNGVLRLTAGIYNFSSFMLRPGATLYLDVASNEMIEINVEGNFSLEDSSRVLFQRDGEGYIPFVRFYTNDADGMVRFGVGVVFNGVLCAPHGDIHVYSGTQCNGALYGKTVTIEPEALVMSGDIADRCADSDHDGVANIIEVLMNTDPDDSNDYIPIAIPSEACIDNSQEVTITYDFSVFFRDYPFAKTMSATFPAGSLVRPFVPLIITVGNEPGEGALFDKPGYEVLGRYINFRPENGLVQDGHFTLQTPRQPVVAAADYQPWQYAGSDWDSVGAADIVSSDAQSVTVDYHATSPVVFAGARKSDVKKTLYFDGGYVYTNSGNSVLRFSIGINRYDAPVDSVTIRINYIDYSTDPAGHAEVYERKCDTLAGADLVPTFFCKEKPLFCAGKMEITAAQLRIHKTDGTMVSCDAALINPLTINQGQTLFMSAGGAAEWFIANPDNKVALHFSPCTETFEAANFGDGRILYDGSGGEDLYTYQYVITDHLGSTRMVVNEDGVPLEAVSYQPYGTMTLVEGVNYNPELAVREKFTGKEYDEEGAGYGVITTDISLDFPLPESDAATPNRMEIYYSDAPDDVSKADVIPVLPSGAAGYGKLVATLTVTEARVIDNIKFRFRNDTIACTVTDIDENVGPDKKVTIIRTFDDIAVFSADMDRDSLVYGVSSVPEGEYYFAGIGKYYFGARYYDPELGFWTSRDAAGQFYSAYAYSNNPALMVDEDGNFFFLLPILIGAAVGGYQGYNIGKAQGHSGLELFGFAFAGAAIGGVSGWATAGIGSYVTGAVGTGMAGSTSAGFWAATAGGATGSAFGGAISGFGTGLLSGSSGSQLWDQTWQGAAMGGVTGGVSSALSYGLSSSYRWQTHKTVLEWANKHDNLNAAVKYVAGVEGFDAKKFTYVGNALQNAEGTTNSLTGEVEIGWRGVTNQNPFVNGEVNPNLFKFDPSNLYETVVHEGIHTDFLARHPESYWKLINNTVLGKCDVWAQETMVRPLLRSNQYYKYWSAYVQGRIVSEMAMPPVGGYGYPGILETIMGY